MTPPAGLRHFLTHLIDYAGLFPPAKLPLDEAIRNYARYRNEEEAWMLGRFIIQAARLGEGELSEPFTFSALGRGGDTAEAFVTGLREDLQAIGTFNRRHAERAMVDVLEVKWPNIAATETMNLLEAIADCIEQHDGPLMLTPYFELSPAASTAFVADLKHFREDGALRRRTKCKPPGVKLRSGGLDAAAFPSVEQIAAVLHTCLTHRVPLKCTAGLHHPFRHYSPGVHATMHGFVNVFGAGVLGQVHGFDEAKLCEILDDGDASNFAFDEHGFAWKDWHATAQEVAFARHEAVVSFGSCSFDEPRDDLRALRWL